MCDRTTKAGDSTHFMPIMPKCSLGYLNEPFDSDGDRIIPNEPFPWLTWNNRPFTSGNELAMVPTYRSSQMLRSFTMKTDTGNKNSEKSEGNLTRIPDNHEYA